MCHFSIELYNSVSYHIYKGIMKFIRDLKFGISQTLSYKTNTCYYISNGHSYDYDAISLIKGYFEKRLQCNNTFYKIIYLVSSYLWM